MSKNIPSGDEISAAKEEQPGKGAGVPPANTGSTAQWRILPPALLLFMLVAWAFHRTLGGDFIEYDDSVYVVRNSHVTSGLTLKNIRWAFGTYETGNWHPVTWLSQMLDCDLYGLNPRGHHLTSVLLHATNAVLLFLLLRSLTGAFWRSLLVAAIFGLHPLRVESVAWISERKDLLSALFWLLTLWAYAAYAKNISGERAKAANDQPQFPHSALRTPHSAFYWLALLFFALGLMSKPMVVTLPCVLLLLDYWPLQRWTRENRWRLLLEKAPFLLLTIFACAVTYAAQRDTGMMNDLAGLPLAARLENALVSYARYLGKLFLPAHLCALYPHPGYWPVENLVSAGSLLTGISLLVFILRRSHPYLVTGWLWYLGTLVPVIGLVQVGPQSMADRYSYLPSIGVLIMLVWGLQEATRKWRWQKAGALAAGGVVASVCLVLTNHQIGYWRDGVRLWSHALAVTQNNFSAHHRLARALVAQGRLNEGIGEFQKVLKLKPDYVEGQNSLGKALVLAGRLDEALAHFQTAAQIQPDNEVAQNNLGNVLLRLGRTAEAVPYCRKAVELQPNSATAHENLGFALSMTGHPDEGIVELRKSLEIQPDNVDAHNTLASVLLQQRRIDEAIREYQEALRLNPAYLDASNGLAVAIGMKKQSPPAAAPPP